MFLSFVRSYDITVDIIILVFLVRCFVAISLLTVAFWHPAVYCCHYAFLLAEIQSNSAWFFAAELETDSTYQVSALLKVMTE